MFICFANRDDWVKKYIFHLWWEEGGPSNSKERMGESSPAVSMVDVEHHDGHILVLIVKLPRLVVELSLHLRWVLFIHLATESKDLMGVVLNVSPECNPYMWNPDPG